MAQSNLSQELLSKIRASEPTIIEFFAVFSRFEYSLKRAGYIKGNENNVAANWDKFAVDLNPFFNLNEQDKNYKLKDAVDYLIKNPPKKQIFSANALSWSETPSLTPEEPLLKWLLIMIRRIRNNLFHGGKFPGAPVKDPTRDQLLLEYSICILIECLCLDAAPAHEIRKYFRSET